MSDEFNDFDKNDSGDDFGDFDIDMDMMDPNEGGKRSVATQVRTAAMSEFASTQAAVAAVSQAATQGLPVGYASVLNDASQVKDDVGRIYDKALKDLKPAKEGLKKVGRAALPTLEKVLPAGMATKLKDSLNKNRDNMNTKVDQDQLAVTGAMANIFGVQQAQSADANANTQANTEQDREISKGQHEQSIGATSKVSDSLNKLVGYQDNILIKYHQKTLELQYKQFFVARDSLALQKAYSVDSKANLELIAKNSGLPNEIKLQLSEQWAQQIKAKVGGSIAEGFGKRIQNLPKKLLGGLGVKANDMVQQLNDAIGMIGDQAEQFGGGGDEAPMIDPAEMLLSGAMGGVRDSMTNKVTSRIWKFLAKHPKVAQSFINAQSFSENKEGMLNRVLAGEDENVPLWVSSMLQALGGAEKGDAETINHNLVADAMSPVSFDMLTRRSIIEIIPGYLSRILQQTTNIATGESNDRIVYSTDREEFTTMKVARADLQLQMEATINGGFSDAAISMLEIIDPKPNQLTEEQRLDFVRNVQRHASKKGQTFDPKYWAQEENYDSKHSRRLARHVSEFFNLDHDGKMMEDEHNEARLRAKQQIMRQYTRSMDSNQGLDELFNSKNATGEKELLRMGGFISKMDGSLADTVNHENKSAMINEAVKRAYDERFDKDEDDTLLDDEEKYELMSAKKRQERKDKLAESELKDPTEYNESTMALAGEISSLRQGAPNHSTPVAGLSGDHLTSVIEAHAHDNRTLLTEIANTLNGGLSIRLGEDGENGVGIATESGPGALKRTLSTGLGLAKGLGTGLWKIGSIPFAGIAKAGGGIKNWLKGRAERTRKHIGDIYLKGSNSPLLRKSLMDMGEYIDVSTGKVITSYADITGEVRDKGNNIIISVSDWKKNAKNFVTSRGEDASGIFSNAMSNVGKLIGYGGDTVGTMLSMTRNAGRSIHSMFVPAIDVYTKDDLDTPKLYKTIFDNGGYFSAGTNNVLRTHKDIDGPVKDVEGNYVVTASDIATKGLCDLTGKELDNRGMIGKILGFGGSMAKNAFAIGQGLLSFGGELLGGAKRMIAGVFNGMFSKLEDGVFGDRAIMIDILGDIFNHMQLAMPVEGQAFIAKGSHAANVAATRKESLARVSTGIKASTERAKEVAREQADKVRKVWDDKDQIFNELQEDVKFKYRIAEEEVSKRIEDAKKVGGDEYKKAVSAGEVLRQQMAEELNTGLIARGVDPDKIAARWKSNKDKVSAWKDSTLDSVKDAKGKVQAKVQGGIENVADMMNLTTEEKHAELEEQREARRIEAEQTALDREAESFENTEQTGILRRVLDAVSVKKLRKGGWKEQMAEDAEDQEEDEDAARLGKQKDKRTSLFKRGGSALAAFRGMIGSGNTEEEELDDDGNPIADYAMSAVDAGSLGSALMPGSIGSALMPGATDPETGRRLTWRERRTRNRELASQQRAEQGERRNERRTASRTRQGNRRGLMRVAGRAGHMIRGAGRPVAMAGRAGLTAASFVAPTLMAGGGTALLGGAGAALAGAGGFLAAVALPVLVGAAALYAGWEAFKFLKRRAKLEPIEKLRYLQYGLPIDSKKARVALRYFESKMDKHVTVLGGSSNDDVGMKVDIEWKTIWKKYATDFDNDPDNTTQGESMKTWYYDRFLPVFAAHKYAATRLGGVDVLDCDDELETEDKGKFVKSVLFTAERASKMRVNPELVTASPWPGIDLVDNRESVKVLAERIITASEKGFDVDLKSGDDLEKVKSLSKKKHEAMFGKGAYDIDDVLDAKQQEALTLARTTKLTEDERKAMRKMNVNERIAFLRKRGGTNITDAQKEASLNLMRIVKSANHLNNMEISESMILYKNASDDAGRKLAVASLVREFSNDLPNGATPPGPEEVEILMQSILKNSNGEESSWQSEGAYNDFLAKLIKDKDLLDIDKAGVQDAAMAAPFTTMLLPFGGKSIEMLTVLKIDIINHGWVMHFNSMYANVRATEDGVVLAIEDRGELNYLVTIQHINGTVSVHSNLASIESGVMRGSVISKGANIGSCATPPKSNVDEYISGYQYFASNAINRLGSPIEPIGYMSKGQKRVLGDLLIRYFNSATGEMTDAPRDDKLWKALLGMGIEEEVVTRPEDLMVDTNKTIKDKSIFEDEFNTSSRNSVSVRSHNSNIVNPTQPKSTGAQAEEVQRNKLGAVVKPPIVNVNTDMSTLEQSGSESVDIGNKQLNLLAELIGEQRRSNDIAEMQGTMNMSQYETGSLATANRKSVAGSSVSGTRAVTSSK